MTPSLYEVGPLRFDDANVLSRGHGGDRSSRRMTLANSRTVRRREETDYTPRFREGRGLGWLIVDGRYPQTGRLFPAGSFGHCGHTGQSIYISRALNLSVVILTNATRFSAMKHDFITDDYGTVEALRAEIHNALADDLAIE